VSACDFAIVFLAVAAGSTVKGVRGVGLPLTAVPLMSLAIGVENAVVAIALPNLGSNAAILVGTRSSKIEIEGLRTFIVVGGATAVGGAWILTAVPERWLLLALAAVVSTFLVWRFVAVDPHWSPRVRKRGRVPVAAATGLAQGSIGISGPIVAPWFQGHGLSRDAFMYANSYVFLVTGVAQITGLTISGAWTGDRLIGALVASVAIAIVQPVAFRLGRRLDQSAFDLAVTAVLCVAVVSLVVRAI